MRSGNLGHRPAGGPLVVRNSQGSAFPSKTVTQSCVLAFFFCTGVYFSFTFTLWAKDFVIPTVFRSVFWACPLVATMDFTAYLWCPMHSSNQKLWATRVQRDGKTPLPSWSISFTFFPAGFLCSAWSEIHFGIPFKKYFI